MTASSSETRRLRIADELNAAELTRRDHGAPGGAPSVLAKTVTVTTYPTVAARFYGCVALGVLGTEVEGGTPAITARATVFYALNLGSSVPPVGTQVLATFVGRRFVFRYDS